MNSVRVLLALALMFTAGCGGGMDPSGRIEVSGAVTLDGQPVSSGRVTFVPDRNSDNPAAAGPLDESGRFHIPSSEGPMPGAYTVKFTINPTAAENKLARLGPTDNQTFEETATIAADAPAELNFNLTSPQSKTTRSR